MPLSPTPLLFGAPPTADAAAGGGTGSAGEPSPAPLAAPSEVAKWKVGIVCLRLKDSDPQKLVEALRIRAQLWAGGFGAGLDGAIAPPPAPPTETPPKTESQGPLQALATMSTGVAKPAEERWMGIEQAEVDVLLERNEGDPLLTAATVLATSVRVSSLERRLGFYDGLPTEPQANKSASSGSASGPDRSKSESSNPFGGKIETSNFFGGRSEPVVSQGAACQLPWFAVWAVGCLQARSAAVSSWAQPRPTDASGRVHTLQTALHALRHKTKGEIPTELPPGVSPAGVLALLLEYLAALPARLVSAGMEQDSRT